jgi:putative nucleotidyltransferase with HDIG domain
VVTAAERETLRRLAFLKCAVGLSYLAAFFLRQGSVAPSVPMLLAPAAIGGGLALLLAAQAGRATSLARATALLLDLAAVTAVHQGWPHTLPPAPGWWDAGWLPLYTAAAVAIDGAAAPAGLAAAALVGGVAAGWFLGNPLVVGAAGAAALIAAVAGAPLRRHLLPADWTARLAQAAEPAVPLRHRSPVPMPDPSGAAQAASGHSRPAVGEADLRTAAALAGTGQLALLIRSQARRARVPRGDLYVLSGGEVHRYDVTLDPTASAGGLGFFPPTGLILPEDSYVKPLYGRDGEVGRLVVPAWRTAAGGPLLPAREALLALLAATWSLRLDNQRLAAEAESRLLDIVESLITGVEAKDVYTSGHSKRVCKYSELLAETLGVSGRELEEVAIGAALHDVGKLGIPEPVLTKPSRLDEHEWELVRSHPKIGARIIDSFNQSQIVVDIIFHHHERYDGKGYPAGLAGDAIPFHARIAAVADALDAMTSGRSYQRNRTMLEALDELKRGAGTQFDPAVVQAAVSLPITVLEAIAPKPPAEPPAPSAPPPAPAAAATTILAPAPAPVLVQRSGAHPASEPAAVPA